MVTPELRELDAEVHRAVFGRSSQWLREHFGKDAALALRDRETGEPVPGYSSNRAAAQLVIDHLWASGEFAEISVRRYFAHGSGEACACVEFRAKTYTWSTGFYCRIERVADEALAICRAALKAKAPGGE